MRNLQPIRYSPAGVAVMMFDLQHQSQQSEANTALSVSVNLRAQAAGELA